MKIVRWYLLLVVLPLLGVLGILRLGQTLSAPPGQRLTDPATAAPPLPTAFDLPTLLIQIAVILVAARLVGALFRRIHQPQVIGEMIAGILLGPSLLGLVAPELFVSLFPPGSLGFLNALSQLGLLVFMFMVGLELDPELLRGRGRAALVISHVSIVAPFLLGALLAFWLYPRLGEGDVGFTGFALFMGVAMSITAFPVLARILQERGLLRTRVGAVTLACAAVDDVTAWCILAGVVMIVRAEATHLPLWWTLVGSTVYVMVMVYLVSPMLGRLVRWQQREGQISQSLLAVALLLVLASAWITAWLGIHALFGAFLVGAIMPKDHIFVHTLTEKLRDFTVVLLLPIFFAFTGLRTHIGLDIGVISPTVFAMMVIMALVTTFMTTPLLELIYPVRSIREDTLESRVTPAPPVAA
ncbi:hypothetical protein BH20GEM3_BH20GEM3_13910 [soil metagenome]